MKLLELAKKNYRENKNSYLLVWGLCLVEFILFRFLYTDKVYDYYRDRDLNVFVFLIALGIGYVILINVRSISMQEEDEILNEEGVGEEEVNKALRRVFDYTALQISIYSLFGLFLIFSIIPQDRIAMIAMLCTFIIYLSISALFALLMRQLEKARGIYLWAMIITYPLWMFALTLLGCAAVG